MTVTMVARPPKNLAATPAAGAKDRPGRVGSPRGGAAAAPADLAEVLRQGRHARGQDGRDEHPDEDICDLDEDARQTEDDERRKDDDGRADDEGGAGGPGLGSSRGA